MNKKSTKSRNRSNSSFILVESAESSKIQNFIWFNFLSTRISRIRIKQFLTLIQPNSTLSIIILIGPLQFSPYPTSPIHLTLNLSHSLTLYLVKKRSSRFIHSHSHFTLLFSIMSRDSLGKIQFSYWQNIIKTTRWIILL